MSDELTRYAISLIWGGMLGVVYFGGLWLSVRHLTNLKQQALWVLASFFLRNGIVAMAFYPVILWGLQPTLMCLAGFIFVRTLFIRRSKIRIKTPME